MKKRPRFLVGILAALLTFGGLMAFLGPRHHGHYGKSNFHHCDQNKNFQKETIKIN
jgi:hypothetical protein